MKKTLAIAALAILAAGCSSINNAGTAEYSIKPFVADPATGKLACCEVTVKNGKEITALEAHIKKQGDDYEITLKEEGVVAFKGQAIAANASKSAIGNAATAATAILAPGMVLP